MRPNPSSVPNRTESARSSALPPPSSGLPASFDAGWALAFACACVMAPSTSEAAPHQLRVQAGPFDRDHTVVRFQLPDDAPQPAALARDGQILPLQVDAQSAAFVLPKLARNTETTFTLVPAPAAPIPGGIRVRRDGSRLQAEREQPSKNRPAGPQALLTYQAEPGVLPRANIKEAFRRGGYLHPIHAPNGRVVTDDFPPNHIHHHGVWWAWTKTEFQGRHPDFWNMGDGTGRVEFESVDASWSGPIHGGFQARHRFVDLKAQPAQVALEETWTVTAYAAPADPSGAWMFDLTSVQRCATSDALRLPEYRYGGVGIRGNWAWNGKTNVSFLTSSGETNRDKGNASRGRWCDMNGLVDGARVGIAILGHPSNFRAPEPMRLHPDEPFFNFAPQQAGDMSIEPGQTYTARYRFVVHDGPPDPATLNRLWNDFAHPPTAQVLAGQPPASR